MIVFKGKRALNLSVPQGVLVRVQEKGWIDEKLMAEYIDQTWKPYVEKTTKELGLLDNQAFLTLNSFRAHTTEFEELETMTAVIPGGCTSKLQPLDVSVNKPFKAILRSCWIKFVHDEVEAAEDQAAKIRPATKQQVADWIVTAWQQMETKKDLIE